jgi:acyl carrier protein
METFLIEKIEELAFTKVTPSDVLWPNVLDSITIVELSVEIENEFGISIPLEEIVESNFQTVNSICTFIKAKLA